MGVLPLQFLQGQNAQELGLTGEEVFDISGIESDLSPGQVLKVTAMREGGERIEFKVATRLDTSVEVDYYRNGGVLHTILRRLARDR
jgi:aconitate hydratase